MPKKIGIAISDKNANLLDYLLAIKGLNATKAIELALETCFKNELNQAIEYKNTLNQFKAKYADPVVNADNSSVESDSNNDSTNATTDMPTDNQADIESVNASKIDYAKLRLVGTKDEYTQLLSNGNDVKFVYLLKKQVQKHFDEKFKTTYDTLKLAYKVNALTNEIKSSDQYVFVESNDNGGTQ